MNKKLILGIFLLFLLGYALELSADTIYLKNGRSMKGFIKREDDGNIELDVGFGTVKFSQDEIKEIYRSTPEEAENIYKSWENGKRRDEKKKIEKEREKEREPKAVKVSQEMRGHIIVEAVLNKNVPVSLVLDTGATLVLLSKEIGDKLKIKVNRRSQMVEMQLADGRKTKAAFVVLESITVQGVEAKNIEAAVLLENINGTGFMDGLLGMSFLKNFNFKVDQRNKKLILEKLY